MALTEAEVYEKVKSVIVEQLGVSEEEVTMDASYTDDLGADSLDTVELVMALEEEFEVEMDYITSPDLSGKTLILIDPMLATGRSLEKVYHALLRFGIPAQTHIAAVIASPEGVDFLQKRVPQCRLWVGALDERLNEQYYIVPGLGDAGDLSFGNK